MKLEVLYAPDVVSYSRFQTLSSYYKNYSVWVEGECQLPCLPENKP